MGEFEVFPMKYIIEHLEEGINGWSKLEYEHILSKGKDLSLVVTRNTLESLPENLKRIATCIPSNEWELEKQKRVLLLDPASKEELTPADAENFGMLEN